MPNEGGNIFQRIPVWVWVGGAAVIAYFLFFRNSSSSATPTTGGGGGQISTGATTIKKGAVNVSISQGSGGPDQDHNGQPSPPPPPDKQSKSFRVPKNETFGKFGESRHWSENTWDELQQFKQPKGTTYAGQILNLSKPLKKGDTVARPYGQE